MDKVQKHNSFNTNTPSSESYRNYTPFLLLVLLLSPHFLSAYMNSIPSYTPVYIYDPFHVPFTSPWRWRQYGPWKHWYHTTSLHSIIKW